MDTEAPGPAAGRAARFGRSAGLRVRAARGTIINAVFLVGVDTLGILRAFIVAAFLSVTDYGVWGIVVAIVAVLGLSRSIGVSQKYVQQDQDEDPALAFQHAFTVGAMANGAVLILMVALIAPVVAITANPEIVAPALVMVLAIPAITLQAPTWVFYRRMEFARQRTLQSFEPLVGFAVTIGLAAAGFGYWALVAGFTAGAWAGAIAAAIASPYPYALKTDGVVLRDYLSFSWPILIVAISVVLMTQVSILLGEAVLGLAGAGIITLAASITAYTEKVDSILSGTLYPTISAVRDRVDLLSESFIKSNRLALMWGFPFGIGLLLFAPDLVRFVIGEQWNGAIGLLQVMGLIAAVNHIGFNWYAYYLARDDTRPLAIVNVIATTVFLVLLVALMPRFGLGGFAIALAATTFVALICRVRYVLRLFPDIELARYVTRAVLPSVPAIAAIVAVRALDPLERGALVALFELGLYLALTALATFLMERDLLREVVGYLRGRSTPVASRA